ncbi:hypothetical protein [Agrobacterium burrii]
MRRSLVKIALTGFLVTSGLVSPALSQELRMAIWSANEAHLALFNEIADEFEASHIPASRSTTIGLHTKDMPPP